MHRHTYIDIQNQMIWNHIRIVYRALQFRGERISCKTKFLTVKQLNHSLTNLYMFRSKTILGIYFDDKLVNKLEWSTRSYKLDL